MIQLSVVICTYNPDLMVLDTVFHHLKNQTLPFEAWELLIIDNNSPVPLSNRVNLDWHPNARIISEPRPGLMNARIAGANNVTSDLIVFVDDDNLLDMKYLETALNFSKNNPKVGAMGGKSLPVYEQDPPSWLNETGISLGCRDYGDSLVIQAPEKSIREYPRFAPIGTGLVIRTSLLLQIIDEIQSNPIRRALGRTGTQLISGEDNDMMLTAFKFGWSLAYVPSLVVHHKIQKGRVTLSYLERMAFASNRSWVVVLDIHNICPWKPIHPFTVRFREWKSFFVQKPWKSPLHKIRWKGACGRFHGLSDIYKQKSKSVNVGV